MALCALLPRAAAAAIALSSLATLTSLSTGCGPVAPYERGHLARRNMQVGGMGELTFGEEHAQGYREGAMGGGSVQAGGCGCN